MNTRARFSGAIGAAFAVALAGGCTTVLGDITFDRSTGGGSTGGGGATTTTTSSSSGTGGGAATCAELMCDPLATCDSTAATPKCTCPAGYDDHGDGKTCTDYDECKGEGNGNTCSALQTCTNTPGGFTCACNQPGTYEYPAGSGMCVDDPCLPNPCDHHGLCTNDTGTAVCTCVYFVDGAATGAGTGDGWKDAFTSIQEAIVAADTQVKAGAATCEVWVKEGTYYVYNAADADNGIALRTNVGVYGGFAGTETLRGEADWKAHPTTLIGRDKNDSTLVAKHVVAGYDVQNAVIDGFEITGGNAVGGSPEQGKGGGVLSYVFNSDITTMTISRCEIYGNAALDGGGIGVQLHNGKTSTTTITDCDIHDNSTTYGGGGLSCAGMACTLTNTQIRNNRGLSAGGILSGGPLVADGLLLAENVAFGGEAGGLWIQAGSATLDNVTFRGNRAHGGLGGGLRIDPTIIGAVALTNAAFVGNTADTGGAISDSGAGGVSCNGCTIVGNRATNGGDGIRWINTGPTLTNSIVWGNPSTAAAASGKDIDPPTWASVTASYADIHGYTPTGGTVIDVNPLFTSLPAFFDWVTTKTLSTTTVAVPSHLKYTSGDVVEIGGDGVARAVMTATNNTITFTPALGAPAETGTSIRNWGSALGTIDLHLGASSACVNIGGATAPAKDIDGKARIGAPDIGAYESH